MLTDNSWKFWQNNQWWVTHKIYDVWFYYVSKIPIICPRVTPRNIFKNIFVFAEIFTKIFFFFQSNLRVMIPRSWGRYSAKSRLSSVWYTAEQRLCGVWYTMECWLPWCILHIKFCGFWYPYCPVWRKNGFRCILWKILMIPDAVY